MYQRDQYLLHAEKHTPLDPNEAILTSINPQLLRAPHRLPTPLA